MSGITRTVYFPDREGFRCEVELDIDKESYSNGFAITSVWMNDIDMGEHLNESALELLENIVKAELKGSEFKHYGHITRFAA